KRIRRAQRGRAATQTSENRVCFKRGLATKSTKSHEKKLAVPFRVFRVTNDRFFARREDFGTTKDTKRTKKEKSTPASLCSLCPFWFAWLGCGSPAEMPSGRKRHESPLLRTAATWPSPELAHASTRGFRLTFE